MTAHSPHDLRLDHFGRRIAARLDTANAQLPHHISERLRAARTRAIAASQVQAPQRQTARGLENHNGVGVLHFGDEGLNLWSRLAAIFPLIALVAGLLLVKQVIDTRRADQLAEVDTALLTDDLPPSAYTDPGFLQFLKTAGPAPSDIPPGN